MTDEVVRKVLAIFNDLPSRYKPRNTTDGRREWVPLASIVLARKEAGRCSNAAYSQIKCVSLATGMKCLPRDKIALARGNVIHDWHAEVLALRGFNRWVVDECKTLSEGHGSEWLQQTSELEITDDDDELNTVNRPDCIRMPFKLQQDIEVLMYVSAAPCGDVSMELTMATQDDASPWKAPAPSAKPGDMIGRGHFDQLGIVRRKPSRPDAPITWSKSCSDKLAMKQCTGLLSGLVSQLVEPIYLSTLILPQDQISTTAVERAFSANGRMAKLNSQEISSGWLLQGYAFRPFDVVGTTEKFTFDKEPGAAASNLACLWTPSRQEAIVNGVLMGRKQFDPRGASSVSRKAMVQDVSKIMQMVDPNIRFDAPANSYEHFKGRNREGRAAIKHDVKLMALQGWRTNDGDADWSIGSHAV